VQLTSSPRRALGLVAVGALGMSTAVLGVTGTAAAATDTWTFTTASSGAQKTGVPGLVIDTDGECTIAWVLDGAAGGAGKDGGGLAVPGAKGGRYVVTTDAYDGDVFDFYLGSAGTDAPLGGGTAGTGGENTSDYGGNGNDGTYDGSTYGGGGGAASVVERNQGQWIAAFGGDGGLSRNQVGHDGGVGGLDGEHLDYSNSTDGVNGPATNTGAGVISGTVTCVTGDPVAPGAPKLDGYVDAGDGTAKFWFGPGSSALDQDGTYVRSTYEYQLDGGDWKPFTTGPTGNDAVQNGTITGLTNMKKYSLAIRATGASGTSAASNAVTFTPFRPTAAPATISASVGVSSVRVSWTPPADAAGVVDYVAFAVPDGAQSDGELEVCETVGTSCAIVVKAGRSYSYGVASRDALGNEGDRIFGENPTAVVPASAIPATLPKSDGALTSSDADGKVKAGSQVTISGKDFLPGSTVELIVYSTPVKLGEAVVLADGTFSATVTLPKTLANGVHHLVASGVDVTGNARNLVVEVTVSGGTAVLANTGFSTAPYLGAGALALLGGGGLILASRRRTAA
jgi:LPXTG-motif cell wall-anchored protein